MYSFYNFLVQSGCDVQENDDIAAVMLPNNPEFSLSFMKVHGNWTCMSPVEHIDRFVSEIRKRVRQES